MKNDRGSVAIMVTFALITMCGILGLVVDLGWAYFMKKSAQTAADAAALAAVKAAFGGAAGVSAYNCTGGSVTCASEPVSCTAGPGGNLSAACTAAVQNGFTAGQARTDVTLQASDALTAPTVTGCVPVVHHPPTTGCVDTFYWVTVRVSRSLPQLFSAVLGNTTLNLTARATASVARVEQIGSLILINRENDRWAGDTGNNLLVQGMGASAVKVPGGIALASNAPATQTGGAGVINGGGIVDTTLTLMRSGAGLGGNHPENWLGKKTRRDDGGAFYDPMRLKGGQPPLNSAQSSLPFYPVPGGRLDSSTLGQDGLPLCAGGVCPPGNYFATGVQQGCTRTCPTVATGAPIQVGSDLVFRGGGFSDWVFFGGLEVRGVNVAFDPGRYVLAGVRDTRDPVFGVDNRAHITGGTAENSDAGRLFIFTNSRYEGRLDDTVRSLQTYMTAQFGVGAHLDWLAPASAGGLPQLAFSKVDIQAGSSDRSAVALFGLNPQDTRVIAEGLREFAPVVFWQDQFNSVVRYQQSDSGRSTGQVDVSCGDINSPCTNPYSTAPQLEIWATPNTTYGGTIYQPRGAWTLLHAGGSYVGPLQIISGAMEIVGNPDLVLSSPSTPLTVVTVALIE